MTNQEFYSAILDRVGFRDDGESTASGSADNDLAHERAKAVLNFIEFIKYHGNPEIFIMEYILPLMNNEKMKILRGEQ